MTWIMTSTGRQIDFLTPDPEQINLMDICIALSRNHRFGGHSPLKVGQHLLEVLTLMIQKAAEEHPGLSHKELAEIALVALLHDFPEYVVGDIPTPLKRLLGPEFAQIEDRILTTMLVKWNLIMEYGRWNKLLKWADQEAVEQEAARYKLDGWTVTDDFELVKTENFWVPEDKVITLSDLVWDEELVCTALSAVFIRAMYISGRADLIGGKWIEITADEARKEGRSLEAMLSDPIGLPSMLVSNEVTL